MLPISVVLDEARLLVVDKPSGLTSEEVAAGLGKKLVHRLDKGTSGLLILAADARAVQRMQRLMVRGELERVYRFVAHGPLESGVIESTLVRDRGDGLRGSGPGGKIARTEVEVIALEGPLSFGRARLVTGRTHQIRIHLAERGHPIVGETVYVRDHLAAGRSLVPAKRLLLHAWRLAFFHPMAKRDVVLESPLPSDFFWGAPRPTGERALRRGPGSGPGPG